MQQIYKITPMLKCYFNMELYWNNTFAWVFSWNSLHIFRKPFYKNTYRRLLLTFISVKFLTTATGGHSKTTFAQDSRVLTPSSPLVHPCLFSSTPPRPKVRSFSISVLVKFREKVLVSITSIFGWTQRVF